MRALVALLAASSLAAVAVAGARTTGGASTEAPITSYPSAPRTTKGTNPLRALPTPSECSPSRDSGRGDDYFPLRSLPQTSGDNPLVVGERLTTVLTLVNKKKQRFRIYVSAMTPAPIKRFIESSSGCLEAFALTKSAPTAIEPVQLDVLLVQAAVLATGLSQAKLSAARDAETAAGRPDSLLDVLASLSVDPAEVVEVAAARARAALDAKVAAGELTAAEVDALDTGVLMKDLAGQPHAPFLFDPKELALSPSQEGAVLKRDPERAVFVGLESAGGGNQPKAPNIVWFAFDPLLSAGAVQGYKARCQSYSYVAIKWYSGSSTLRFWRVATPNPIGTRTATSTNRNPSGMDHTSTSNKNYDISVKANLNNTDYSIYGGWVVGSTGTAC